jgi:hypothetical protein
MADQKPVPEKTEEQHDKELSSKLPTSLRDDIGSAFSSVLSNDPSTKVPATRSFMALLQTAMIINGETRYDSLITDHTINSINAVALYASDNWAAAVEICYKIQADLGFLVYCGYGTSDGKSFSIPTASMNMQKEGAKR